MLQKDGRALKVRGQARPERDLCGLAAEPLKQECLKGEARGPGVGVSYHLLLWGLRAQEGAWDRPSESLPLLPRPRPHHTP